MRYMLVLMASCLLWSCAPKVGFAPFNETHRKPTDSVRIFIDPTTIKRPYQEIGLITVNDEGWGRTEVQLIELLRKKAMSIGADGVILQPSEQKFLGFVAKYAITDFVVRGTAIVFEDEQPSDTLPK